MTKLIYHNMRYHDNYRLTLQQGPDRQLRQQVADPQLLRKLQKRNLWNLNTYKLKNKIVKIAAVKIILKGHESLFPLEWKEMKSNPIKSHKTSALQRLLSEVTRPKTKDKHYYFSTNMDGQLDLDSSIQIWQE